VPRSDFIEKMSGSAPPARGEHEQLQAACQQVGYSFERSSVAYPYSIGIRSLLRASQAACAAVGGLEVALELEHVGQILGAGEAEGAVELGRDREPGLSTQARRFGASDWKRDDGRRRQSAAAHRRDRCEYDVAVQAMEVRS
jgi:hypothetical protein